MSTRLLNHFIKEIVRYSSQPIAPGFFGNYMKSELHESMDFSPMSYNLFAVSGTVGVLKCLVPLASLDSHRLVHLVYYF